MFARTVHPGAVLKEEFGEAGLSVAAFARQIAVPPDRIRQIMAGKRAITGDTALRLGHWFGMEPQFWLNLQTQHDLAQAAKDAGEAIQRLPTRLRGTPS
ncbi:HigA family addiction module antitoxin [Acuticoccus kandeliae]|uniref:HigA family addiction module antitoxin n=1 Tax=Acuticoccus kandeliae TaxID=2073160 RepID=UPI000D3E0D63|nr:HigA family addiction module antitoxin [Acuticoccus kandeliae]